MLQNFVFILLLKFLTIDCTAYAFDPEKIDYCNLKCSNNMSSSGCGCHREADREELPVTMAFRETMLKLHNDYRNKIARGDLIDENFPKSSLMMALSYDVELEYLARCYGLTRFVKSLDSCKLPSFCKAGKSASQNIYGQKEKMSDLKSMEKVVQFWFDRYTLISQDRRRQIIQRFEPLGEANSFTQMVWAMHTRVGCARIWNPYNWQEEWRFAVICNYAGFDLSCPGNVRTEEVYGIGEPCGQCVEKCNNQTAGGKYDALCGAVEAIPREIPIIKLLAKKEGHNVGEGKNVGDVKCGEGKPQLHKFLLAVIVYAVIL